MSVLGDFFTGKVVVSPLSRRLRLLFPIPAILLLLVLCLASCVSVNTQTAPPLVFLPTTFICDPPVSPDAQPRPIPPGKQLKDLCPPGARAYPVYDHASFSHIPPPLDMDSP